jgi:hypothetical protein
MRRLKIKAIPSVLLVDTNDRILSFHHGYNPGDEKVLEEEIKKAITTKGKAKNDSL